MTERISEAELRMYEWLVTSGTSGPWLAFANGQEQSSGESFIRVGAPGSEGDMHVRIDSQGKTRPALDNDLELIAQAKQIIPRLVDEIRRLRDESF
jgi:hypothetical protein